MPIYKKLWSEKDPFIIDVNEDKVKVRVRFMILQPKYQNLIPHRTDGPAVIAWDKRMKGATRLYYVKGTSVKPEKFLEVFNAPMENLPLYLYDPILGEIAKDRLAGELSTFELDPEHEYLTGMIVHHGKVLSPKQVLIKNLTTRINQLASKQLWVLVKNLKPFQGLA
jgi:hypothetical protein